MKLRAASGIVLMLFLASMLSLTVTPASADECKILIDQTHEELPEYALTDYISSLQAAGHVVDTLTSGPVTEMALSGYNVFLVILPKVIFSSGEVSAIVSFVSNGGGLYLVGNYVPECVDPLNSIAINFGVTFNSGDTLGWQTITDITSHPVTLDVDSFHIWASDPLDPVTSPSVSLAWASGGETVLAVTEYLSVKVVFFDDATPLHNSYWTENLSEDDIELQMNIIAWLCQPPIRPPVGGKAISIDKSIIKPELQTPWIGLTTIILSLALVVVYVKKRKRNTEINS